MTRRAPSPPLVLPTVRPATDGRPSATSWQSIVPPVDDQPSLLHLHADAPRKVDHPDEAGQQILVHTHGEPWSDDGTSRLPDPATWAVTLCLAVVEAVQSRRSLSQLNRWLTEDVLGVVRIHRRRATLSAGEGRDGQAVLGSVWLQVLDRHAVEVTAHVRWPQRSVAFALRLDARGNRWVCTALELGGGQTWS